VAEAAASSNPLTDFSSQLATRNRDAIDKIRSRADATAKTFGTVGTTVVTAVGISKLGDVFPLQEGLWWPWLVLGTAGFLLMLTAIAVITARLWGVSQPILTRTDPDLMSDNLDADELALVRTIYDESAALNGVRSLRAYEARAHRFDRIGDSLDESSAKKLRDRAATIRGDVLAVTSRAAAQIVKRRSERVVRSRWMVLALLAFVGGVVLFAVSADRLDSARNGEITLAKACADARAANAAESELPALCGPAPRDEMAQVDLDTGKVTLSSNEVALAKACVEARSSGASEVKLSRICGRPPSPPSSSAPPTAAAAADAALVAIAQGLEQCRAALRQETPPGTGVRCAPLERALAAALQSSASR
jgi:hypothetical protein